MFLLVFFFAGTSQNKREFRKISITIVNADSAFTMLRAAPPQNWSNLQVSQMVKLMSQQLTADDVITKSEYVGYSWTKQKQSSGNSWTSID